jgi:hypothetical protein
MVQQENNGGLLSKPWFSNITEKRGNIMGVKKIKADLT